MKHVNILALVLGAFVGLGSMAAQAQSLHTGGKSGFYYAAGTKIAENTPFGVSLDVVESAGSAATLDLLKATPTDAGLVQPDAVAVAIEKDPALRDTLEFMPVAGVKECMFAVVKNGKPVNLRAISKLGAEVTFFVAKGSGSAVTLGLLRSLDPKGLGSAKIVETASAEDAIQSAIATRYGVGFFVQFPDPENARFKLVLNNGGMLVGFADKALESVVVGNKAVYTILETNVSGPVTVIDYNGKASIATAKLATSCMDVMLVTGKATISPAQKRLVDYLSTITKNDLVPSSGVFAMFAQMLDSLTELTGAARDKIYKATGVDLTW